MNAVNAVRIGRKALAGLLVVAALSIASAGVGAAAPTTTDLDVSGKRFLNACTGENVTIVEGTLHILTDWRSDGAGGVHVTVRGNAEHVVAQGETSGVVYHLAGDWWAEQNGRADGSPMVVQLVEVHNMISEGPSANVIVHIVSHVTIDAEGRTTVTVESLRSECRG